MTDLASDNPGTVVADNPPVAEPAATSNGTGTTSGQATGAAPTGDLFKGIDPNRLPPEARAAYDSMLRDYREKTGKLSETVKSEAAKAAEAYRQRAEMYDQIIGQEEFVRQWNEYVQKAQAQPGQTSAVPPELIQMKQQLEEMSQKIQFSEISQITDAFADAVNEKGEKLNPEFDNLNGIHIGSMQEGDKVENYSLLRACIELSPGNHQEKLAAGYKTAKAVYDQIFEAGKKAGMGRLQAKLQNASLPPSISTNETITMTERKPKTAREALEMAKRGQMVSRD